MPNILRKLFSSFSLIFLESQPLLLNTRKTITRLMRIPNNIGIVSNSDFKLMIVVNVPAPAKSGKAIGTIVPSLPCWLMSLKKRMPRVISKPMKNIIKEPANANDDISIPNKLKIVEPKNKKLTIKIPATKVARSALIVTPSLFMFIITGKEPGISMTENKTNVTDKIAFKINITIFFLCYLKNP